jgi:hypothetical protein
MYPSPSMARVGWLWPMSSLKTRHAPLVDLTQPRVQTLFGVRRAT